MDNRREFTRVGVPMYARLTVDGEVFEGRAVDVSMNGLLLELPDAEASGTGALQITLGEDQDAIVVDARAEVARCTPGGIGLKIVEIELDGYRFLREVLLRHAEAPRQVEAELDSHVGLLPAEKPSEAP